MPPSKQIALKRKKPTKLSQKMKMERMRAARQKKLEDDDTNVPSPSLPNIQTPPIVNTPSTPTASTSTQNFTSSPSSASKFKLELFKSNRPTSLIASPSRLPTAIFDFNIFLPLLSTVVCAMCLSNNLDIVTDDSKNQGMAIFFKIICIDCGMILAETFSSDKTGHTFDINKRIVSSSLAAEIGYSSLAKFLELMNLPGVSHQTHASHMSKLEGSISSSISSILADAAAKVREAYGGGQDVIDIAVSFDGSWPKRGFKSKLGIGVVIDAKTGLALDFHVLSTYCHQCITVGDKLVGEEQDAWRQDHSKSCTRNFVGTSGAMEVEAASTLWSRSEQLHGLRYTTLISDGDTKTFTALQNLAPYSVPIEKAECINHVAKRLMTALRNLVASENKRGVRLGGSAKGNLTQAKMGLLQSYYTKAVRTYNSSVQVMSDAIWAGFFHSTSTDQKPQHHLCPKDTDSWCFYQRAQAKGEQPAAHSDRTIKSFLNEKVAGYVRPIYTRLTDPDLLKRCLLGKTQNANESLHATIWNKCPKHLFGGLKRVRIAVALGLAEFNGGASATHDIMASIGCPVSGNSLEKGKVRDRVRIRKAEKALEEVSKTRRRKRLVAQQREEEELERREGGSSYVPGGF